MSKRVGWGIIGCGWIGTEAIAPAIRWSQNGRLVAVASRDRSTALAKAGETGAERAYSPYEAMLADPEVDAVYIGLPNGLHEEWAVRCAEAGKHVLCEKSLTMSAASARRMADAFARRRLRLAEAFMYRHHPQWEVVRRLLEEKAVGRVRLLLASFCGRFDKAVDHRWSATMGGGTLWDLTCYGVNATRYVTRAEPVRAVAFADLQTTEGVDASSTASLEFPGGVLASVTGSLRAGRDQSLTVVGEEGTIHLARPFIPRWDPTSVVLRRVDGEERSYEVGGANQFLHQVEHFASLVLDPSRAAWPAENGVGNVAACEAIERSWRTGAATPVAPIAPV
ncbi:MAG TPA: Gfo/Idh/MocA family oxidoreductase [Polyangiaceae bacterium]|nr:Gfo/Idh/MocA family oxidoreductase [Polyangiaceae bacterium]